MDNSGKKAGRRSRVACKPCNQRKIRCDVTQIGPPCTNCQHETAVCEILPRKKHKWVELVIPGLCFDILT